MKKILLYAGMLTVLAALIGISTATAQVNVTFRVNTATVPDTLVPTDTIQLRGSLAPLTWDNLTGAVLQNTPGGDYWTWTHQFNAGDTMHFKINVKNSAWESNLVDPYGFNDNNRALIVPASDTVLDMEYFNSGAHGKPQYFTPWTPAADSFMNVYFRVNMSGVDTNTSPFNFYKDRDTVAVRGGGSAGADLQWGTSYYLTRESPAVNGGFSYDASNFWSARLRFPKSQVNEGDTIQYKFLIGYTWGRDEYQGGHPNRKFVVPVGKKDTTLEYVYFNDMKPITRPNADTVLVTWRADLATAIANHGFSIGDTLVVQSGFFATGVEQGRQKQLSRLGFSSIYGVTDTVVTSLNKTLDYQYYLIKNGTNYREVYYNFGYAGGITAEQERRQVISSTNAYTIYDTAFNIANPRSQPRFRNITPLSMAHDVVFTVDVRPAFYTVKAGKTLTDRQGSINVTVPDSIFKWGVMINGPATDTNNSWQTWGSILANDTTRIMYDNGTHGDAVAGDSIYSITLHFRQTLDIVGQEFKFGIGGGDNEGGFGNNHIENIDDSQPSSMLANQFGSIDPLFYSAWDYGCGCLATGVNDTKALPLKYTLSQNYPNPFNPTTKIDYTLPTSGFVTLRIYNLLGQLVATPVSDKQTAGTHSLSFDASNYPSGIYFYRITAGTFVSTKKMTLIK